MTNSIQRMFRTGWSSRDSMKTTNAVGKPNLAPLLSLKSLSSFHQRLALASLVIIAPCFCCRLAVAAAPFAVTQPAGQVRSTRAVLNGMIVPRGEPTAAWFEWGTDRTYGDSTPPVEVGSGATTIRVSAPIADLTLGAVYHYRLVASNASGVVFGCDQMLTTGTKIASWTDTGNSGYSAPIGGLSNIVAVACGHGHSLGLRNDGTVVCWGLMGGQYWNVGQTNVPAGLSNVVAVAGGYSHSLALKEDGTVVAWGRYDSSSQSVVVPDNLTNVIAIAAGDWHSVALKSDGRVFVWGTQDSGGNLTAPSFLSNVVAIAAGSSHSIALRADGTVVGWGRSFAWNATPPSGLTNVVAISAESWHNLALRSDGSIVGWGDSQSGKTTAPAGLRDVLAVATGFGHSLALTNGGKVVAWGSSSYTSRVPPDLRDVSAIASGDYHSVALTSANLMPTAFSRTFTCQMDVDSVLTLLARDPNGDPLNYVIRSLPTNGMIFQYSESGRGNQITTPDTLVADRSGRVIFLPQPSSASAPYDLFTFNAVDGEFESSAASVTVNILPAPALKSLGFSGQDANLSFSFFFNGVPNISYSILATSNFKSWSLLGTTQSVSGEIRFVDTSVTNQSIRFYRVRTP